MTRRGLWVVCAVACSSTPHTPQSQPPQETRGESEPIATPIAACPKPDEPKPVVEARPRPGPRGRFGGNLEPRHEPVKGATCQAARTTLDATNASLLAAAKPAPSTTKRAAWDRKTDPARWGRVAQRFGLDERHRANLARDGFVVSDRTFWTYVEAYHEVFQSQLPIFVSIDSILHAIYASHAGIVADIEREVFAPKIEAILSAMHCGMAVHAKHWPAEIARDVDLYLAVARSLLAEHPRLGKAVPSLLGNEQQVKDMLKRIAEGGIKEIELFGRRRMVDFGMFQSSSARYTYGREALYFRAMMWLSRIEFNLVSRGSRSSTKIVDTSETPREVAVALALVELARATNTLDEIRSVDAGWSELAGPREDLGFDELDKLRERAKITRVDLGAQPALAKQIGKGPKRWIPIHVTPDGVTDLPTIAAMIGARVTPDTTAFLPIVQPAVPQRTEVGAADVAYILGHDRAKAHVADLAAFPNLGKQLDVARWSLGTRRDSGLYGAWLDAIRALAKPPAGALPSFATSDAYADLKVASAINAFGQLRTSYELMTGMSYLGSGCEIPDGYVEPAVAVYDALIQYAERGRQILAIIDPANKANTEVYFTRLATTLRVLRSIIDTQLADQPLTELQKQWLSMVVEIVVDDSASGAPPTYAGWYFDLFRNFRDATSQPDFVAGIAKSAEKRSYIGGSDPRMGVFVVDTGGAPRVVTGPIARPFESHSTTFDVLSVESFDPQYASDAKDPPPVLEPWAARYLVRETAKPPAVDITELWDGSPTLTFSVTAPANVGPITLRALDHHRVPIATITRQIGKGTIKIAFGIKRDKIEMVQLVAGKFQDWREMPGLSGDGGMRFHYLPRKEETP